MNGEAHPSPFFCHLWFENGRQFGKSVPVTDLQDSEIQTAYLQTAEYVFSHTVDSRYLDFGYLE